MDGSTCLAVVSSPKYCLPSSHKKMMQPKAMSSTRCMSGHHFRVRTYSSCRNILGVYFAGEKVRKHSFFVEPITISRNYSLSKSIRISATVTPIRPVKGTRQNDGGYSRPSTRSVSQVVGKKQDEFRKVGKSSADKPDDWSKGWPGGEKALNGWVEMLELKPSVAREFAQSYDPDKLADMMAEQPGQVRARAFSIIKNLGFFAANVLLDKQLGRQNKQSRLQRARELRQILCQLGPSFIKVGQSLSVRPDICPQEYLDEFSGLQDNIPSFPTSIAFALIKEELGVPLEDVFSEISLEPVAAASLGQVYKARLRSTGELVAVKVQRPGIGDSIALDMFLVRKAAAWADENTEISRSTPLVNIVDEFASRLFAELDYIKEGHNAERFDSLYGSLPRIRVPKIYWEHTSRRVLTMKWIEGVKLTDEHGLRGYGMKAVDFVDLGVDCTMRQLLEHGYFHADPHPGNILATRAGELVYLDFGMMSEAPLSARYGIMAHVVHLVNREYGAMARDYYTLGFLDSNVDVAPLVPELANFFDDVLNKSVSELNLKSIIDGLAEVLYRFPFQVPAYYALIARSLTVLEGIAMRSDPSYKLIARAYPYIAKRLLTDEAEELRGALEEFLIQNGSFRWARLEDLINEGRKVGGIREEQLWSFLHWLVSEQKAYGVRGALVHDLIPIIEAVGIDATRSAAASIAGIMRISREEAEALVDRAIPLKLSERQALQRALLLQGIGGTAASSSARTESPAKREVEEQRGRAPWDIPTEFISSVQGSVDGVRQQIERTREQFDRTVPELQRLLESPNLANMANEIGRGLLTRLSARALKIVLREDPNKEQ
ncbi:hypothetical protein KC19_VG250800 [Ceratodon purpureus]|uniref:Protein kinase domain-containing protein n=1 Tax=Ceratodon purpureus TaxID=3225 RepID=A0A8T0HU18_CERPU|nr:hypothetical protein KC19_VG250800 [Ceratodon purpureus]